ncbi:hypothetical protein MMC21_004934 [Puttea exsequens]|nr:hypothetical protein [Puttea exsequens]
MPSASDTHIDVPPRDKPQGLPFSLHGFLRDLDPSDDGHVKTYAAISRRLLNVDGSNTKEPYSSVEFAITASIAYYDNYRRSEMMEILRMTYIKAGSKEDQKDAFSWGFCLTNQRQYSFPMCLALECAILVLSMKFSSFKDPPFIEHFIWYATQLLCAP